MNRPRTLCDFDWQTVRMITVQGLSVRVLDAEAEFTFEFGNAAELQAALQHWSGHAPLDEPHHHAAPVSVTMSVHEAGSMQKL